MNKQIKYLAEQAGCAWREGRGLRDMSRCHHELEKFAELIIENFAYEIMDLHGSSPEHIIYAAKRYGVEL